MLRAVLEKYLPEDCVMCRYVVLLTKPQFQEGNMKLTNLVGRGAQANVYEYEGNAVRLFHAGVRWLPIMAACRMDERYNEETPPLERWVMENHR